MSTYAASPTSSHAIAEPMAEMNMTPLIDVMLVLIIMLIITIPRQHHSVNLNLPSNGKPRVDQVVVQIDVDFDGTIAWNGLTVPTRAALDRLPDDPRIRIARYPLGYHLLTRDLDAAVVAHDVASWIIDPSRPLPSGAGRSP